MSLKKIGHFLSSERKRQRKSIHQISQITCISLLRLKEIEEGYHNPQLAPIYLQGYIKAYAQCLNIDFQQLLQLLHQVKENQNLKLTQPKKIGKVLTPFLSIANISMMFAICMFTGLIGWTRVMIDKYETNSGESFLQRNLSQTPFTQENICDENFPSYLKNKCELQTSEEK